MDLARLEAGQEYRRLRPFDAAHMLHEFCDSIRPLAAERNLFLKAEGPAALTVVGDSAKILRIAQNLVLNALKVTEHGGVCVQWEERASAGPPQWVLCVQDTGPGFQPQSAAAPLESALRQATREAQQLDAGASAGAGTEPAATLKSQSDPRSLSVPAGRRYRPVDRQAPVRAARCQPGARDRARGRHDVPRGTAARLSRG